MINTYGAKKLITQRMTMLTVKLLSITLSLKFAELFADLALVWFVYCNFKSVTILSIVIACSMIGIPIVRLVGGAAIDAFGASRMLRISSWLFSACITFILLSILGYTSSLTFMFTRAMLVIIIAVLIFIGVTMLHLYDLSMACIIPALAEPSLRTKLFSAINASRSAVSVLGPLLWIIIAKTLGGTLPTLSVALALSFTASLISLFLPSGSASIGSITQQFRGYKNILTMIMKMSELRNAIIAYVLNGGAITTFLGLLATVMILKVLNLGRIGLGLSSSLQGSIALLCFTLLSVTRVKNIRKILISTLCVLSGLAALLVTCFPTSYGLFIAIALSTLTTCFLSYSLASAIYGRKIDVGKLFGFSQALNSIAASILILACGLLINLLGMDIAALVIVLLIALGTTLNCL